MNPTAAFWWDLLGRLLIESSALMALAAVVSRKLRPQQQRIVWQVALGALLLLLVSEGTGLHRQMRFSSAEVRGPSTSRRLTIEVMPGPEITSLAPAQPSIQVKPSGGSWVPGIIWLAVAGGILARTFGSRLLFVVLKRRRRPVNDPTLQQKVDELARLLNLRGRVHLSESRQLAGPIAFGFLRRCICVPETFAPNHTSHEQEVMLAHELAHLAARDPLWYAIVDFAAALFWFNPLVWFGRAQFQTASETAADEASLLVPEGGARTLAECLVQIGKRMAQVNSYGWIGIEGNRFRSVLGRRVDRLLKIEGTPWRTLPRRWPFVAWSVGAITSIALLASSAAFARQPYSLVEHLALGLAVQGMQLAPVPDTDRVLHTRYFRVDAWRFEQSVKEFIDKRQIPAGDSFAQELKLFIESLGVDLSPPAQMFYNSRLGTLLVRAEIDDLDAVEKLVQVLNASPPQLTIEARFVECSEPLDVLELRDLVLGYEAGPNPFRGILPPSRFRDLMKRLEARKGVDILTTPRVTTLSGRQAQIKVVDVKYIVTDLDYPDTGTNGPMPITEPFELGPVLDVVPVVRPDGMSIQMNLVSTIREFLGYDMNPMRYFDSGTPSPLTPAPLREYAGEKNPDTVDPIPFSFDANIPLPTFRMRQAQTTVSVWDGQTVVLSLPIRTQSPKPNIKFAPSGKTCFLFVTPTLIDAAGNRLHGESALPFVEQTVPE